MMATFDREEEKAEPPGDDRSVAAKVPAPVRVAVLIWAHRRPDRWIEGFQSACRLDIAETVRFVTGEDDDAKLDRFTHPKAVVSKSPSLPAACHDLFAEGFDQVLVVIHPVVFPARALERACAWMDADPRVGTMSFLSNAAGYLSFPYRNTEHPVGPIGHNEESLTHLLRTRGPEVGPVPIPVCEGSAVLLGRSAFVTAGGLLQAYHAYPQFLLAEFSLRATRRGFNSFLDPTTFVSKPWDVIGHEMSVLMRPEARHALFTEHHFFPGLHDHERDHGNGNLSQALDLARAKQDGLRVLVDASELGPQQMGTQVLTLAMSLALAENPAVKSVIVALPDPTNVPAYAQKLLRTEKISVIGCGNLDFPNAPNVDIIHRPYQPTRPIPWGRWRQIAKRSIITVQDVIGYRNGAYHTSWEYWHNYRENFRAQVERADGIFCITQDVVEAVREERLPIDRSRVFVVENGVDHLSTDLPADVPQGLIDRGLVSTPFLVILGTTYAHKNRDLGVRVWQALVARGRRVALVMAGANVPMGTNRLEEAALLADRNDALVLPDVTDRERNWLLRHASLVLYPTSAEGFGLVPFEAAEMGCPCLHVSFGPLRELLGREELPERFDLEGLVAAAERLLDDPAARQRNIERARRVRDKLSWSAHAAKAVEAYFQVIGNVPR